MGPKKWMREGSQNWAHGVGEEAGRKSSAMAE